MKIVPFLVSGGAVCALLAPAPADALPGRCDAVLGVAHRGSTATGNSENTIAAFNAAFRLGADTVETDVRISSDGRFMLIHDRTLNRTTTGTGQVADRTSTYIRTQRLESGGKVPFLRDALAAVRRTGGRMFLEIKPSPYWNLAKVQAFTRLINNSLMRQSTVVVASPEKLRLINKAAPRISTAWKNPAVLTVQNIRRLANGLVTSRMRAVNIAAMRNAGLSVWARSVDTAAEWAPLIKRNVDGVYTDHIKRLVSWCRA